MENLYLVEAYTDNREMIKFVWVRAKNEEIASIKSRMIPNFEEVIGIEQYANTKRLNTMRSGFNFIYTINLYPDDFNGLGGHTFVI